MEDNWMTRCGSWGWLLGVQSCDSLPEFCDALRAKFELYKAGMAASGLELEEPTPAVNEAVIEAPRICLGYRGLNDHRNNLKFFTVQLDAPNGLQFTFGEFLWLSNEASFDRLTDCDHNSFEYVSRSPPPGRYEIPSELKQLPYYGLECGS